ncbi:efflux transporter periplasmic adaptor subunit [Vibrio azureus]|uniref:Putative efflux pump membrane fusion protein n=1 Tax=Vibrio azureus NBRC 104587 TaxID=1219077 RepID=U3ATC7_9VIBR|nr:efflux RND transporter periplasmic adaptor subunit [Vibrio azureus]AUI88548.1 efflux transporter periplasmic adaptor subunit [Vibrio azureus]GAD77015.1 putative efflux pump membrane fusion protein [Vibrio azureus NBRC 104587]
MLTKLRLRWLLPFAVAGGAYFTYQAIAQTSPANETVKEVREEPTVQASALFPTDHKVVITGYGEIVPFEQTLLAAQVSGEVISWHPNFVQGGFVKRGEVLLTIAKDNYEAALLQAEAELANARAMLIEEQAKAEVAKRQAKTLSARQVSDLYLRKPQLLSAQAQVKSAQAAIKRAQRDLENCNIIAPYDALVVARDIGVGQFVSAGARVAVLNNVEFAEVHIPVAGFDSVFLPDSLADLDAVVTQQDIAKNQRQGKVVRDLGIVDSATRMSNVVIQVEDPYGLNNHQLPLKFGSFVEVNFTGKELKHIYRLPQELVRNRTVWVVNEQDQLEERVVNVLREEGEYLVIGKGLNESDKVVLTLPEYPQQGMTVKVVQSDDDSSSLVQ